jgi:hypothetical protein
VLDWLVQIHLHLVPGLTGKLAGTDLYGRAAPKQAPKSPPRRVTSPMHEAFGLDLALEGAGFCR